ncbi:NAD(P)H-dependent oxidoreductase [Pseudomonas sp. GD04087]|uniref:NAD(P)H-dependent oxidoreductase n=1 Tax=unclassified Pseudomonas TaxID=196821 RepID=UPI00244C8EED|nr:MULTISPECIES: NAD(P)H-dependent oxidoreductase [unclassified Pseudomonas]MDH0289506.1 NAD(P)H-dependent oxidoreductase [Pseudomonas sp. GD04087]MDH1050998.1 NAD(P)H-dependent oxidoreductase [Pseudomonas sp. GD03903]MDH1999267.1 NAD(P)H-dependent oxidoreductase [Pseudomonas sp. GD03691]
MRQKRILLILGHPSGDSFCAALAERYREAASGAGHEVRLLCLGELAFDPLLRHGYNGAQALEPDLLQAQQAIAWADHLALVFPVWWGGVPALLKGFLDRVLLPGFAFRYRKGSPFPEKLLKGRTAHLLVTMDTPPWYFRWLQRMPALQQMRRATLEFCGIRPTHTLMLGPLLHSPPQRRESWLRQVQALAAG